MTHPPPRSRITEYNADGQQTSLTDADGNTTFSTYDSVGRQLTKVNSLGSKWTYSYDPNGNLISTTDADGRTTNYTYNQLNQVTAENWIGSDGTTVIRTITYTYNDKNQLQSVSDPDSSYAYTYNAAGQVTSVDNNGTPNMPDVTLTQTYDGVGNLASLAAAVGGSNVFTNNYGYDTLGQMTQVTQSGPGVSDKGATFAYNALGQFTSIATFGSTTTSDPDNKQFVWIQRRQRAVLPHPDERIDRRDDRRVRIDLRCQRADHRSDRSGRLHRLRVRSRRAADRRQRHGAAGRPGIRLRRECQPHVHNHRL